jgi:transposase InsO family protein
MKGEHHIGLRGERLGVSRSGYSRWERTRPSARSREDATLKIEIARFHRQSRGNDGAPWIAADLREAGCRTTRRRCTRLMTQLGVRGKKKHRRKPRTPDSRQGHTVAPNLLKSADAPSAPN